MNELQKIPNEEIKTQELSLENRLDIIEEGIRKKYLSRLTEMRVAPPENMLPLEEDLIDNVRLYRITEMVYHKGELATDKFTTVFNTLSIYKTSVFIIIDSNGEKTNFYIGVRNNETNEEEKRSTVTIGDALKNTLVGHFPGIKIKNEDRSQISALSYKILQQRNISSVSVVGNSKSDREQSNEHFVQGLEKLVLAMQGRKYIGVIIAQSQSSSDIQLLRKNYQELYTKLSPLQKIQTSENKTDSTSKSRSFTEMNGKQKSAMISGALLSIAGVVGGAFLGGANAAAGAVSAASSMITKTISGFGATGGAMVGGQVAGQLNSFINSLAPNEQITKSISTSTTTTTENKTVTDLLKLLDDTIKRTNEFDSYGMWNTAGYFVSNDMSAAEIAASNYRSLMNGEKSGREISAINSWRGNDDRIIEDFNYLLTYISRFYHPQFFYGYSDEYCVLTDTTTSISGKELGLHLGLPRTTTPGLPVIEHAEFGKEVTTYSLLNKEEEINPEDRMTLGKVFDLGQITNKVVELNNKSLNMHTFITGSTGSGKSNTVYQMLAELHQDKIPFLVVEPAKGEYKDIFGNWDDVSVYSTNPNIAPLINLNPFMFPESLHVLEHIDGLVEIFSVCWPMYDAMPAFFKDAILKSYEAVGWDLGSSVFEGNKIEYPDFEVLAEQLDILIDNSDYASDIKSNYRGALITRVKSLTVGLNKFIFTAEQTPYEKLFDRNCILDISRVKSMETKALLMGLTVYILNEYRMDKKTGNNNDLKHITVLEEAHNLLKNTSDNRESELIGKSVEMLTQTIAEIRTYGEGFIIVDQSPSSVDIAAIKNTNTKIVLRTPEANDRNAIGKSMGLTDDQVNEIAKLPSGVAVVYQNDWVSPVLTMIDKANVEESQYVNEHPTIIMSLKEARTNIIYALMQPWIKRERIDKKTLDNALAVLELTRSDRRQIASYLNDYDYLGGEMLWNIQDIPILQTCLKAVLNITEAEFVRILTSATANHFIKIISDKTDMLDNNEVIEICNILTKGEE